MAQGLKHGAPSKHRTYFSINLAGQGCLPNVEVPSVDQMWHTDRMYETPGEDRTQYSILNDIARQTC